MNALNAISPLDGRYRPLSAPLAAYFSEDALQHRRLEVEVLYFSLLCGYPKTGIRRLSKKERSVLAALKGMPAGGAKRIKALEERTGHDVKAAEYFIKERLSNTTLEDLAEFVHFALTSEDVNNLAYALMLSRSLSAVMLPALKELLSELKLRSKLYAGTPLLARTHGQPAVGTTFGKEFAVFAARLQRQIVSIEGSGISVKFSGAAGNYNAHLAAYPAIDWPAFSAKLIGAANKGLAIKLVLNPAATQIEPHDTYAELFDTLRRINTVLLDFAQDMWRYISSDLVVQKNMTGEVGSSTMPQKINPIQFENAEGNLGIANALFSFFSAKLPVSRLQRDLSDSTVERNFGVAFAHSLIAYRSLAEGLRRSQVNAAKAAEELQGRPEIYAEALQTVLRREGFKNPYEALKELTRGRSITRADLQNFIVRLPVKEKIKKELLALIAGPYIGLAAEIAGEVAKKGYYAR